MTTGPAGPAGKDGQAGPAGPAVAPKVFAASLDSKNLPHDNETVALQKPVPDGTYAITAKLTVFQAAADNGAARRTPAASRSTPSPSSRTWRTRARR